MTVNTPENKPEDGLAQDKVDANVTQQKIDSAIAHKKGRGIPGDIWVFVFFQQTCQANAVGGPTCHEKGFHEIQKGWAVVGLGLKSLIEVFDSLFGLICLYV